MEYPIKKDLFKNVLIKKLMKELPRHRELTGAGVKEAKIDIMEEIPNVLSIYSGSYKFCIDLIRGMYVMAENDFTDEFDYYMGHKVTIGDDVKYEFNPKENRINWKYIREMEAAINYIYLSTYNMVMYGKLYADSRIYGVGEIKEFFANQLTPLSNDQISPLYITKAYVDKVGEIYTKNMVELFRLNPNDSENTFVVKSQPSYLHTPELIIYVQTGYPDNGYGLDCSDREFYLTLNPTSLDWKYSKDFPWVSEPIDLFSMTPGAIEESLDFKSALQLVCNKTSHDLVMLYSSEAIKDLFTFDEQSVGLETNEKKVKVIIEKFLSELLINYPPKKPGVNIELSGPLTWYGIKNCKNGITRLFIGKLVIDIAIEYCGMVDIAVTKEIENDTWDDIFYCDCSNILQRYSYPNEEKDKELKHYLDCENLESKTIMEDITNIITQVLYLANQLV